MSSKKKKFIPVSNQMIQNTNELKKLRNHIKHEIYFQKHIQGKLINITNIFKVDQKYTIEMHIQDQRNQNHQLLDHFQNYLHEYPLFLDFLDKNYSRKQPFPIQFYFTKDLQPVVFVNKRGFYFLDFLSFLQDPSISLNQFSFESNNNKKIF